MADYKDIVGTTVRSNAGSLTSAKTGELFYDSTNLDFIYRNPNVTSAGAWRTGGSMNTGREQLTGVSVGTQTAGLVFSGDTPSPGGTAVTEKYNGSTWTEVNNLNGAKRAVAGYGTQTSALCAGGFQPSETVNVETFDGTSWTEIANLNTARAYVTGAGADNTSGIVFSGNDGTNNLAITESWNNTSWTEVNDMNTARSSVSSTGTGSSALAIGGSPFAAITELWNGTNWTEVADLNTGRERSNAGGTDSTLAVAFAGAKSPNYTVTVDVETWNGTAWTEIANVSTARGSGADGFASGAANGFLGGGTPPTTNVTEEWTGPAAAAVTFTSS